MIIVGKLSMAKTKDHKFIKELGGAIKHKEVSPPVKVLTEKGLIQGSVLDYGCGHGYDVEHHGWDGYDPYYRQQMPDGEYDTILCNHVANILTRKSRTEMLEKINELLAPGGKAYIIVSRRIPETGKAGIYKRIQNYVVLTLPSIYFLENEYEIFEMEKDAKFKDKTKEFEDTL